MENFSKKVGKIERGIVLAGTLLAGCGTEQIGQPKRVEIASIEQQALDDTHIRFPQSQRPNVSRGVLPTPELHLRHQTQRVPFHHVSADVRGIPQTPELEAQRIYIETLDTYPNLAEIKTTLDSPEFTYQTPDGRVESARTVVHALMEIFSRQATLSDRTTEIEQRLEHIPTDDKIYLLRVAHMLTVEFQHLVPWSLDSYTTDEIHSLVFTPSLHKEGVDVLPPADEITEVQPPVAGPYYLPEIYPEPQLEVDATYQLDVLANGFLADTQGETVRNAVRWIQSNFFHAYQEQDGTTWGWEEMYADGRSEPEGYPYFLPENLGRYFDERGGGCHEPVVVLAGSLRALNIPAFNLSLFGHGATYLPREQAFVHGDHLAIYKMVPVNLLLLTRDDLTGFTPDTGMMYESLNTKLEQQFGYEPAGAFLRWMPFHRVGHALQYSNPFFGEVTDQLFSTMQEEVPENHFRWENGNIVSDPIQIRTLDELSQSAVE